MDTVRQNKTSHVWRAIVFGAEFVYMTFELLAIRLLSPSVGTSLEVWTAVIGCVLGASALGNYLGGRLSRRPYMLPAALIGAAVLCAAAPFLEGGVLASLEGSSLVTTALVASFCLFFLPSCAAGMVPPLVMDRVVDASGEVGQRAGGVYAAATLGGLLGTFVSGFYLIPTFGTITLVFGCAATYAFLAVVAALTLVLVQAEPRRVHMGLGIGSVVVACVCILGAVGAASFMTVGDDVNFWKDTKYGRVHVYDTQLVDKGPARIMNVDGGYESGMLLGEGRETDPIFDYMNLIEQTVSGDLKTPESAVTVLGGAAYSMPKYFLANTQANVSVAEIDEDVTELAREWFALNEISDANPGRLKLYEMDGRIALGEIAEKSQDIVINDTFAGLVPARTLASYEAMTDAKKLLKDDGMYVVNLIGTPGKNTFLDYECATLGEAFEHVRVFAVGVPGQYGNYIAFASDGDLSQLNISSNWEEIDVPMPHDKRILSDDWCPVERLAEAGE